MAAHAGWVVVAETARLTLRRITADDLEALVALHGDAQVMRYLTGRPTPAEEVQEALLPGYLAEYERPGGLGHWAAVERTSGEMVGWFELSPTADDPAILDLGYRLRRASWGTGYATEGARAVVDMAFRQCGANRVTSQTMTLNVGSRRVMEHLGMHVVRTFHAEWPDHIDGAELGDVEYAIDRDVWAAQVS